MSKMDCHTFQDLVDIDLTQEKVRDQQEVACDSGRQLLFKQYLEIHVPLYPEFIGESQKLDIKTPIRFPSNDNYLKIG